MEGALNVPRSPQGYPLLVQAGSSEDGKELAAQYAEAVFTAQQTLEDAQAFYSDLKQRTRGLGRDPDSIKILPGIVPVIGGTEAEALALDAELDLIVNLARRERLTVRQLIGRLGGGRGHRTFAGTPEQVADAIQHWWDNGAADGFNVMPPVLPSGLAAFVEHVVPILQRRGLFRREYEGKTLRDNYGLARPHNRNEHAEPLRAAG